MTQIETRVFEGDASHYRFAYLKFVDNKVVFDDSDEEYGPIEFDIELLINALEIHANRCLKANIDLL
jgi:hypothetical protein